MGRNIKRSFIQKTLADFVIRDYCFGLSQCMTFSTTEQMQEKRCIDCEAVVI